MTEAYPLQWPQGWARTKHPQRARFATSRARSISELHQELRRLGATNVVVSSNVQTYFRGGMERAYANQRVEDAGVAIYFTLEGHQQCFPCDKWDDVGDNIHAIELTVKALRGLERWGAKEMVTAAFRGFKALPHPDDVIAMPQHRPWYEVLEVSPEASTEMRKAAYRVKVKKCHPDKGGSRQEWDELVRAAEEAGVKKNTSKQRK